MRPPPQAVPRLAIAFVVTLASYAHLDAEELPEEFVSDVLVSQLESPVALEVLPDGRILVAQQRGRILAISPDGRSAPIWTVPDVNAEGERGLLGLAAHPEFDDNGLLYLYYTVDGSTLHNRLSRITLDGDLVVGDLEVLVDFPSIGSAIRHMGGALRFTRDNGDSRPLLFLAIGDRAERHLAQDLSNPFGKIHRFLDDGSVPPDNPLIDPSTVTTSSIWAYGLRNPFTFAIQPETGRLFANDVGSKDWEEVNEIVAGGNFGWPRSEGPEVAAGEIAPLYAYPHSAGACAVTGGVFYPLQGGLYPPDYYGQYFFSDFCAGWIRRLDPESGEVGTFASGLDAPTNLALDRDGRLIYLSRDTTDADAGIRGRVIRIGVADAPPSPELPRILESPRSATVAAGATVTFSARVENADSMVWLRNDAPLPDEIRPTLVLTDVGPGDSGARFRLRASNVFGSTTSDEAVLTVLAGSSPVPEITLPPPGSFFATGETVPFAGGATDREDGALSPSRLSWEVVLRHDEHFHPFLLPEGGIAEGAFTMPEIEHGPGLSWLELRLSAEDEAGNRTTTSRAIMPRSLVDGERDDLLLVRDARFVATTTFVDPRTSTRHAARAEPITGQFGAFWFFRPDNPELFLKVLDGTALNGAHWVFWGGLSELEFTVTVLDTLTGQAWTRTNPRGTMGAEGDVEAFPGTGRGQGSRADASLATEGSVERARPIVHLPLLRNRFHVLLNWRDPRTGRIGPGVPVPLTDESGMYWFMERTNFEVAVKMLDGRPVNGHYWLFLTALTDLEVTLTIRDTVTGVEREYVKPPFGFQAFSDFEALPGR